MPVEKEFEELIPTSTQQICHCASRVLLPTGWLELDGVHALLLKGPELPGQTGPTYIAWPASGYGDKVMFIAASAVLGIETDVEHPEEDIIAIPPITSGPFAP